jgi:hypothetical protein
MRRLAGGLPDALPGHWTASSYPSLGKVRPAGLLCKLPLGRRVGEPGLADLDGDRAEILVGADDGRLYCLRGDRAAGE